MKTIINTTFALVAVILISPLSAQVQIPVAATIHEGYPILKASELLKPEVLKGPYHTVMEAVPTQGFANQYTVQTNWGVFTVRGNHLLAKRIHEFQAIARLEQASKGEAFERALREAAAKPFHAVGGALEDPVGAVKKIGAGAGRLFKKAGEAIERGGKKSANTDNVLRGVLGFSKAKREIAGYLEVDPYSENLILQRKLDDMARASFAGGFLVRAGTFALSSGANVGLAKAAGTVNLAANVATSVYQNDPTSLSLLNRATLKRLGVSEMGASAFLEHPNITPSQQTELTRNLARLGPVPGIEDYLKMVATSRDAAEVAYFVNSISMMASYHEKISPGKRVLSLFGLPAIHAENNALVIPLAVDYGSWSPEADRLSAALAAYQPQVTISQRVLYIAGRVSARARTEIEGRGFIVTDGTHVPLYKLPINNLPLNNIPLNK